MPGTICRKTVFLSILLACAGTRAEAAAGDTSAPDALFEKGQYAEALAGYETLLQDRSEETRLKAFYRCAESEALLFRYGEAATRAFSAKLPGNKIWKARMLILRAELGREFLKQYGRSAPQDVEEGAADLTKRTPEEWHSMVKDAYQGLWDLRTELSRVPLSGEGYFVSLKDADLEGLPTLWDFVVLRMSGYLLAEAPAQGGLPEARAFLRQDYDGKFSINGPPAETAASLFEDAARMTGRERDAARSLWKLRRLLLPVEAPSRVESSSDHRADMETAVDLLLAWKGTFKGPASARASLEAAKLLHQIGQPDRSVALCKEVEKSASVFLAKQAAKLRAQIEMPSMTLIPVPAPPPGKGSIKVATKNLERVYFRLYRAGPEELKTAQPDHWSTGWTPLRRPEEKLIASYAGRVPEHAWSAVVKTTSPYILTTTVSDPPGLKAGLYLAMASSDPEFKPGSSMLSAAALNITELFMVVTTGPLGPERDFILDPSSSIAGPSPSVTTSGFHVYAFDALSGEPRPARVSAYRQARWSDWTREELSLNDAGVGHARVSLTLSDMEPSYFSFDPLASHRDSYAFLSYAANLHFSGRAPYEIRLETDRPIYRPGQEVRVKATVLARIPRGWKVYDGKSWLSLKVQDANGVEFFGKTLALNAMGSASASLVIPTGRLLGRYSLTASITAAGRTRMGWGGFSVEEYKRPEFEVLIQESSGPWKYGEPVTVSGSARYYFGGPVADAPVDFRVFREPFFPWWCWWWRSWGSNRGRVLVHSGQARTGPDGGFSLAFTPQPPDDAGKDPMPSRFTVEALGRDPGGRTIAAERSFKAGAKSLLVSLTPSAGFFPAAAKGAVEVKLVTLDETPTSGEVFFILNRVDGLPAADKPDASWDGGFREETSLEEAFKDAADGAELRRGKLAVVPGKSARIDLRLQAEGVYRLTARARDPWGGEVEQSIILVGTGSSDKPLLNLPPVAIPEHTTCLPGEKARVLLGSAKLKGAVFVEVWAGSFLLESRVLDRGGLRIVEIPVSHDHKGGFWVRWFSGRDFRVDTGQAGFEVPWKDKELNVKLYSDKVLKPGQKARWRVQASDRGGKPVSGEATARVFDRSLEYYMAADKPWVRDLYPPRSAPTGGQGSLFPPSVGSVPLTEGWMRKLLDLFREAIAEPALPELRLNRSRVHPRRFAGRARSKADKMSMPVEENVLAMRGDAMTAMEAVGGTAPQSAPAARAEGKAAPAAPDVKARSDFSETALFDPHLKVRAGAGTLAFTAPERLTSWKIQASVLTRDAKVGTVEAEAVTRKDLMARLELPRFLREGDKGTIKVLIHNETDRSMSGGINLAVKEDGKDAPLRLGLEWDSLTLVGNRKPHSVESHSWPITAPEGLTTFKIKVFASGDGGLTDAEEKELPILPSRQRLVETAFASLDGDGTSRLKLSGYDEADAARRDESVTLQVDPQLALSIMNSLPFLVHYPFECVEQTLNRFVPLGIVNSFYKKHPGLAEAVRKIPKRDTITPAWDRSDPRRLTDLMETPWQQIAQGRKSPYPLVDLFDDEVVRKELSSSRDKLLAAQNGDGSFPWFPGGRPDPYITLLVLSGFSEAQRYGVDIPKDPVSRALSYIQSEIPRRLKSSLKPDESLVSTILYAAYVVTSFDKNTAGTDGLWTLAKAWADYADRHSDAMTPIGKAYAAHVYWRLGEKAKGDQYLTRAMDGIREDPVAGAYWTPEKISWLWYNDSVEKHAFILRTLLLIRPKDPRVAGMVRWLMFNRKGNEWKSTKAASAAIYSLLDVLKARGALDKGDSYSVKWGPDTLAASVSPMDWLAQPLRWARTGMDIRPGHGTASVSKQGPGLGFASLTWIYTTDKPAKSSGPGLLQLDRRFFLRVVDGKGFKLKPLDSGGTVRVGDEIEVKLSVTSRSQFEYVHLKDPKAAGLEASELLSGWRWDRLSRYEEPRDSVTNFFLDWIPHGEYEFGYRLRPTLPGSYRVGAAVLQSMYAPEMAAHSDGFQLKVVE